MSRTIALVEDEPAIRENYAAVLRSQGYGVETHADRQGALVAFRARLPDLAIIDIGLGEEADGGFALCRELRALSATLPIIFLTARDGDLDVISGLRLGADDYLSKQISLPHILARIAALLRRVEVMAGPSRPADRLVRGALTLDVARLQAAWRGVPVDLTVTEFWILHALVRYPGHVKSREQLMQEANTVVDDSTITSHIKRIRRKLIGADPDFHAIDTVYGMGYRWRDGS